MFDKKPLDHLESGIFLAKVGDQKGASRQFIIEKKNNPTRAAMYYPMGIKSKKRKKQGINGRIIALSLVALTCMALLVFTDIRNLPSDVPRVLGYHIATEPTVNEAEDTNFNDQPIVLTSLANIYHKKEPVVQDNVDLVKTLDDMGLGLPLFAGISAIIVVSIFLIHDAVSVYLRQKS